MKNIKAFAIITTAVCGLYFTSAAQTTTQGTDASKTQSQTQTSQQQSDDISLGTSPTIEKSSQGYKVQVWVESETDVNADFDRDNDNLNRDLNRGVDNMNRDLDRETDKMNRDINRETDEMNRDLNRDADKWDQNKKIGTESDKTLDKNKSNTGSDELKSPSTTGTSGTIGTTGTTSTTKSNTGTTGSTLGSTSTTGTTGTTGTATTVKDPSVIGSGTALESSTTPTQSANAGTTRTSSDNAWSQSDQSTALNNTDKSKVVVKIIDESTGKEVKAEDIEMKVTTPSKKSFTTDLKEKANHHEGELALTEEGTYNIQATIKTDDKNVVIPMEYENKSDHSSDKSFDKNYDTEKK